MPETATNEVIVAAARERDEDGNPIVEPRLTPSQDTRDKVCLMEPIAVIPIVFLPGIMGTNLKAKQGNAVAWRPPNTDGLGSILSAIGQLVSFWFKGAASRQRRLNPDKVEVDPRGPIDAEGTIRSKIAKARGWGTVMRSAYHPVMSQMQRRLDNIMEACQALEWWNDEALRAPADYGEQNANPPLSEDDLKHAASYRFEVWGGGYNWLQSNRGSGQALRDYIENTVLASYPEDNRPRKVILVTHSMGGFVARALTEIHGYDKVLGVVHGVMPATGAPATYHHCRCGYDGIASVILGRNAAEVVAIMANSPGALELVPTPDYADGRPWLKLGDGALPGQMLPMRGDPYEEIYLSRAWYGLVPAHNEQMINPAGIGAAGHSIDGDVLGIRSEFDEHLDGVKDFHEQISKGYPHPAYSHYGADIRVHTWSEVQWQGALPGAIDLWQVQDDNGNGRLRLNQGAHSVALEFAKPAGAGDGTVPTESGAAPDSAGIQASFRQGDQGQGPHARLNNKGKDKGYEHQPSYNDARAQWATLYSIVRIAKQADWA